MFHLKHRDVIINKHRNSQTFDQQRERTTEQKYHPGSQTLGKIWAKNQSKKKKKIHNQKIQQAGSGGNLIHLGASHTQNHTHVWENVSSFLLLFGCFERYPLPSSKSMLTLSCQITFLFVLGIPRESGTLRENLDRRAGIGAEPSQAWPGLAWKIRLGLKWHQNG